MTAQTGPPHVTWELHPEDYQKIDGDTYRRGLTETHALQLADADGALRPFYPLLMEQFSDDYEVVRDLVEL